MRELKDSKALIIWKLVNNGGGDFNKSSSIAISRWFPSSTSCLSVRPSVSVASNILSMHNASFGFHPRRQTESESSPTNPLAAASTTPLNMDKLGTGNEIKPLEVIEKYAKNKKIIKKIYLYSILLWSTFVHLWSQEVLRDTANYQIISPVFHEGDCA